MPACEDSRPVRARARARLRPVLAVLPGLPLVAVLLALPANPEARQHHPQNAACDGCHRASGAITAGNAGDLVAPEETLCAGCHQDAVVLSHPSGVPMTAEPPPDLPLDSRGRVTCSTCHDVHGAGAGRMRTARTGRELCQSCHAPAFFAAMHDEGQSLVRSGHMNAARTVTAAAVDRFSAQCLECHDEKSDHGASKANHPVGKDYARWVSYGGYRAPGAIPEPIRLVDGMVSCVSCHEGYTRDHGKLVMSNEGSRMCFGCHDL